MGKGKPSIPRKGTNPAALELALKKRNQSFTDAMTALDNLTKMVTENCRILGQLVVMFEILKEKGIITNDEIKDKFDQLQKDREEAERKIEEDARKELDAERQRLAHPDETNENPNGDSEGSESGGVQSSQSGDDEDNQ